MKRCKTHAHLTLGLNRMTPLLNLERSTTKRATNQSAHQERICSMSDSVLERLSHADYWDEQYSEVGPDEQLHEWFRSFDDLLPFFQQNLLARPGSEVKILHLGSGDSVSTGLPAYSCDIVLLLIDLCILSISCECVKFHWGREN